MPITIIRDLNDLPEATETWRAALAECPPIVGGNYQRWCVAWGKCYASLAGGVRPLVWSDEENTDVNGCRWFDSLEEAEAYLADVEAANQDAPHPYAE